MQENTYSRLMKSIASIVLVAFIMFVLEPATKAAHVLHQEYEQNRAAEAREQAGQLAGTLDNVEAALVRLQTEFSAKARLRNADPGLAEQVREALPSYREQLNALDEQVHTDFNATEARLRGKNLPPEILRRHQEAVAAYEQKMQTLLGNLDNIAGIAEESPENIQKLKSAVDRTLEHLQPLLTRGKHAPFDPEQLPFSIPKGEVRSVSLKADEEARGQSSAPPRRESDGVLRIAARSGGNAAEGECAPAPANPEDKCYTAPTEDVQITQEIRDLAATKGGNPVGVYKWVHNNIQFIPAWGSIQGSDMTLKTKSGNAFDTASLLIALLRASDIPARYVHGTVQIPIKKVMNWAGGAEVPEAAVQLLAQGGIPVTAQTQGGKIAFVKMEHVWVEAWVDFEPSRGAKHRKGKGDTWVPMDASFKQYAFTKGMKADIEENVRFDPDFAERATQSAEINKEKGWVSGIDQDYIQTALENYQRQMTDYINQTNAGATVGEVLGTQTIIPSNRPVLAMGLPYKVWDRGETHAELPADYRHEFQFNLYTSESAEIMNNPVIKFKKSLPELAGKRITLSFTPASDNDRAIIESFLPTVSDSGEIDPASLPASLPGHLIRLKAELKIDGEKVVNIDTDVEIDDFTFKMGNELRSVTGITRLAGGWHLAHNKPIAGEFYAFGLDLQGVSAEQLEDVKKRMETVKDRLERREFEGLTKDEIIGDMLYAEAITYFAANDIHLKILNRRSKALAYRQPSFGTFSTNLESVYNGFDQSLQVKMNGIMGDMDAVVQSVWTKDNDAQTSLLIARQIGMTASAWEHRIPELFWSRQTPGEVAAVSAVKALTIAAQQGKRIYQITSANISVLDELSIGAEVKDEIRAAAAVGQEAIVSESTITVAGWTGVGYIISDPDTGAGAYRISGGENGIIHLLEEAVAALMEFISFAIEVAMILIIGLLQFLEVIILFCAMMVGLFALVVVALMFPAEAILITAAVLIGIIYSDIAMALIALGIIAAAAGVYVLGLVIVALGMALYVLQQEGYALRRRIDNKKSSYWVLGRYYSLDSA